MMLLLTGFEPFGRFTRNPSWDALVYADERGWLPESCALEQIPVDYASAFSVLAAAVDRHSPRAIVSFGLHGGMLNREEATIYIETTPRNRDGAVKPDNAGVKRDNVEIIKGAPPTLEASFPARALVQSLQEAGFTAALSDDAGAYLCNHLFYREVHTYGERFACGFVHVPPVRDSGGSMHLEDLARATAIIADVMIGTQEQR